MSRRRCLTATVTLAAITAATLTTVLPANAMEGACPSGFVRIANLDLKSDTGAVAPGKIQLYSKSSTGEKCALVRHNGKADGVRDATSVSLQPEGGSAKTDSGDFMYYAGPVVVKTTSCVTLSGDLTYSGVTYSYSNTGWCASGSTTASPSNVVSNGAKTTTTVKNTTTTTKKPAVTAKVVSPIAGSRGGNSYGQMGSGRTVPHRGIDFSAGCGTTVRAATAGTLKKQSGVSWAGTYLVTVTSPDGIVTRYAHMQSFPVASGTKVTAGQKIGTVGARGNATGCHLHFEVALPGKGTVNPRPWLDKNVKKF